MLLILNVVYARNDCASTPTEFITLYRLFFMMYLHYRTKIYKDQKILMCRYVDCLDAVAAEHMGVLWCKRNGTLTVRCAV